MGNTCPLQGNTGIARFINRNFFSTEQSIALNNTGVDYDNKNDIGNAINCFKEAKEVDRNNSVALVNYANLILKKDPKQALLLLQKAKGIGFDKNSSDPKFMSQQANYYQARANFLLGNYKEAEKYLKGIPGDSSLSDNAAQLLQKIHSLPKAAYGTPKDKGWGFGLWQDPNGSQGDIIRKIKGMSKKVYPYDDARRQEYEISAIRAYKARKNGDVLPPAPAKPTTFVLKPTTTSSPVIAALTGKGIDKPKTLKETMDTVIRQNPIGFDPQSTEIVKPGPAAQKPAAPTAPAPAASAPTPVKPAVVKHVAPVKPAQESAPASSASAPTLVKPPVVKHVVPRKPAQVPDTVTPAPSTKKPSGFVLKTPVLTTSDITPDGKITKEGSAKITAAVDHSDNAAEDLNKAMLNVYRKRQQEIDEYNAKYGIKS